MGIIHSFPNKINWAFKVGGGGAGLQKKTARGNKKLNKSSDTETNKQRGLEDLGLPSAGNAVTARPY